ncbi:hypothetical protein ACERNI_01615 [Camelimonas sp. ID_303_24]
MKRSLVSTAAIGLLAAGCASHPGSEIRKMPRERILEAAQAVTVAPSPVSTIEFKELGETARFKILGQLIQKTWRSECQVAASRLDGYSPNGSSSWNVRCQGGVQLVDYVVALPERRVTGARVMKCDAIGPRRIRCSVFAYSR